MLKEFIQAYICHIIIIEYCLPNIHSFQIAKISTANAQPVILLKTYKNFENVFSIENTSDLAPYKDYDYAIDFINN